MPFPGSVTNLLDEVAAAPTYARYQSVGGALAKLDLDAMDVAASSRVRIALLGSATIEPLAPILLVECLEHGLVPSFFVGGFSQYRQALLDPGSEYCRFAPDVTFLFAELESLAPAAIDPAAMVRHIGQLADAHAAHGAGLLVVADFLPPPMFPYAIHPADAENTVDAVNRELRGKFANDPRVFIAGLARLASYHGLSRAVSPKLRIVASLPWSDSFFPVVGRYCAGIAAARQGLVRKCVVVDLDNTLWGGVIGEDGLDGIQLGPEGPGRAYYDLQRVLLDLTGRGIVLAVNSKNNESDALEVLRRHPHMILREGHFAALQMNWDDKVTNMRRLARDLSIGLDTFVFLDDSPQERHLVRRELPEVLTLELPSDPAQFATAVRETRGLESFTVTTEDLSRTRMYAEDRERRESAARCASLDEYLDSLRMTLTIARASHADLDRMHQLVLRTNQFNLTTRRHDRQELQAMLADATVRIYTLRTADMFGDSGLTGLAVVRTTPPSWRIEDLLMSCRVLGRTIEQEFMSQILEDAAAAGALEAVGVFMPTDKNAPAAPFYAQYGFDRIDPGPQRQVFTLPLSRRKPPRPDRFEILR